MSSCPHGKITPWEWIGEVCHQCFNYNKSLTKERTIMTDEELKAAIVAALQPVAQQAGKPVSYSFASATPATVSGEVAPQ